MRHLGVCYQTAWSLKHKLMEAMREREKGLTLSGTVQIDEAFLGGQASGRASVGRKGKVALLAAVSAAPDCKAAKVCLSKQPAMAKAVVFSLLGSMNRSSAPCLVAQICVARPASLGPLSVRLSLAKLAQP